jgi:hypothetical protein
MDGRGKPLPPLSVVSCIGIHDHTANLEGRGFGSSDEKTLLTNLTLYLAMNGGGHSGESEGLTGTMDMENCPDTSRTTLMDQ